MLNSAELLRNAAEPVEVNIYTLLLWQSRDGAELDRTHSWENLGVSAVLEAT